MLPRCESEPGGELTAAAELLRINDGDCQRAGGEYADTAQAHHALCAQIGLCITCDFGVTFVEMGFEFAKVSELAHHTAAQRLGQRLVGQRSARAGDGRSGAIGVEAAKLGQQATQSV